MAKYTEVPIFAGIVLNVVTVSLIVLGAVGYGV